MKKIIFLLFLLFFMSATSFACSPMDPQVWFNVEMVLLNEDIPKEIKIFSSENGFFIHNDSDLTLLLVSKSSDHSILKLRKWGVLSMSRLIDELSLKGELGDNRPVDVKVPEDIILEIPYSLEGASLENSDKKFLKIQVKYKLNPEYIDPHSVRDSSKACDEMEAEAMKAMQKEIK